MSCTFGHQHKELNQHTNSMNKLSSYICVCVCVLVKCKKEISFDNINNITQEGGMDSTAGIQVGKFKRKRGYH